eukprot:c20685_g1_i1 orf=2-478(-)
MSKNGLHSKNGKNSHCYIFAPYRSSPPLIPLLGFIILSLPCVIGLLPSFPEVFVDLLFVAKQSLLPNLSTNSGALVVVIQLAPSLAPPVTGSFGSSRRWRLPRRLLLLLLPSLAPSLAAPSLVAPSVVVGFLVRSLARWLCATVISSLKPYMLKAFPKS